MVRKKLKILYIFFYLSIILLLFFDSTNINEISSHEYNIVLLDDMPEINSIKK